MNLNGLLEVRPGWGRDWSADLLADVHSRFRYLPGEGRATGNVVPTPTIATLVEIELRARITTVVFQAYRDGHAHCAWHADADRQAILSLGATRTMAVRVYGKDLPFPISDGDLVLMPPGLWHAILTDPAEHHERVSLVFRTPAKEEP